MLKYIIRRLLQSIPVIFGVSIVTFAVTELAPGDAVSAILVAQNQGFRVSEEVMAELRHQYGLDQPAPYRYVLWLRSVLEGNLGIRVTNDEPVSEAVGRHLPATLQLMGAAILLAMVIGIPIGIFCALKQYSWADYLATTMIFAGISLPEFFVAIGAIFIFSLGLGWFPTGGYATIGARLPFPDSVLDHLEHLVLPAAVLAFSGIASWVRYTRASMLEVLHSDYVTVARSKGLGEKAVIVRHMFRNALMPLVTIFCLSLPALVGGTLLVETVFNWPGMGVLYRDAIGTRDYPLIMGMVLITSVMIIASNLLADILYAWVDPRIRYDSH